MIKSHFEYDIVSFDNGFMVVLMGEVVMKYAGGDTVRRNLCWCGKQ